MAEIQIIPLGKYKYKDGSEFLISEDDVAYMVAAKEEIKRDLVIDYNHRTIETALTGGEAPAAGWIKSLINKGGDGLWAAVEWTDKAKEAIEKKEYKYLSGYFAWNRLAENGKTYRVLLDNAALTNWPWIQNIKTISASTQDGADEKSARIAIEIKSVHSAQCAVQGEEDKGVRTGVSAPRTTKGGTKEMEKLKAWLIKWLGLAEDVGDEELETKALEALDNLVDIAGQGEEGEEKKKAEEVAASAKAGKDAMGMIEAVRKTLGLDEKASETQITGKIVSLSAQAGDADKRTETEKELAGIKQKMAEKERDELVAAALTAGKITPAQKEWADEYALKDADGFKAWELASPVVVSLGAGTPVPKRPEGDGLTDSEKKSAKMAGLDDKTYRKHNPISEA